MDMSGEYRIPAPRDKVWQALNDPEILKQAIPGCEELIKTSDTDLEAKVTAKVGPVKAKFGGKVRLENINAPESYSIVGEGKGGAAGFAKGGADVHLAEDGSDTILTYSAKAEVGGKLAQIGSRLVQGAAKKTADDFFGKFSQIVGEGHAAASAAAPAGEATTVAAAAAPPTAAPSAAAPSAATAAPASPPAAKAAPAATGKSGLGGLGMPAYIGIGVVVLILLYLIFS